MRGKQRRLEARFLGRGITPADAGKTHLVRVVRHISEDHPRGCGENAVPVLGIAAKLGSPPRMRGKRILINDCCARTRITPADAGKTRTQRGGATPARDHPRGCGENVGGGCAPARLHGSPPRMRGKPLKEESVPILDRITPADAGKTNLDRVAFDPHRDHPRGCGENGLPSAVVFRLSGSPPRMRGKQSTDLELIANARITPADAGKTLKDAFPIFARQDHPRGCGENKVLRFGLIMRTGSPPRMRGKPRCNI